MQGFGRDADVENRKLRKHAPARGRPGSVFQDAWEITEMERCLLVKLLVTAGAGTVAGIGGFYAKQMTGALVGAGIGGVLGWLFSPGCEKPALVAPSTTLARATTSASPIKTFASRFTAPVAPIASQTALPSSTPECGAHEKWSPEWGRCVEIVR